MSINYIGFLTALLHSIFSLPIKGIIYAELEFVLMHLYLAYRALLAGADLVAPIVIMVIAIIVMLCSVVGRRPHIGHHAWHTGTRFFRAIGRVLWRIVTALGRSWYYMIYGAVMTDDASHIIRLSYGHNVTRVSLNYLIGRTLYRGFNRLLGIIPPVRRRVWLQNGLAHFLATAVAVVLLTWRIWYFATDWVS